MKQRHIAPLFLGLTGAILLMLGIIRGNSHEYDMNGHYLDKTTGISYSEQSTEILDLGGMLTLAVGVILFSRSNGRKLTV